MMGRMRGRRMLESFVFMTTFCASLVTVSASTFLTCPVNNGKPRNTFNEEKQLEQEKLVEREKLPVGGLGQRAHLTKEGGWIEIDNRPSIFSLRRWTA